MAARLVVDILSEFNSRGIDQAQSKMGRLGGALGKVGALAAGAAAAGVAAFAAGTVKAVTAASDLQQSVGAVESTFSGAGLKAIRDFGSTAATSVGLSESAFNQLAAVSGSMLQNLGYDSQEAADATLQLGQRAADLAATFGGTTQGAMEAFQAALRGEMDPLEQFGVKLSAADIASKAAAMGLDTSTAAAEKHANAQAALALIMEQTNSKAGTFAEEAGTMAGGMQILGAQVQDVFAKLGTALLPIIEQLIGFIQANVVPAVQQFADWLTNLGGSFTTTGGAASVFQTVVDALRAAWEAIWPVLQKAWDLFVQVADTLRSALQPVIEAVASFMTGTFLPAIQGIWQTIGRELIPAWQKLVGALRPVLNWLGRVAAAAMGPLSQAFRIVGGAIKVVITIIGKIISVIASLIGGVTRAAGAVGRAFSAAWRTLGSAISGARSFLTRVGSVIGRVVSTVGRAASAVSGTFASAWRSASSAISSVIGVVSRVIGTIRRAISAVRDFFSSGIGKIGGAIGGLFGRSATGRSATTMARASGATTGTISGVANPQELAHNLSRVMTGARIRTGFTGVRL